MAISLLNEDLVAKIKGIQIRARSLVNDVFAGEYQSAFKGRGIEFEEVREYQPGDDIRSIDWNVTARNDKPFIKVFRDERELTVMFVVDVSASSRFGTVKKFKNEVAAEVTALLAYTALRNNDKVGLIIFSDHVEHYLPPKKGRAHIWRLIRDILSYESESRQTNLNVPLEFLNRVIKRRCITFVVSDFMDEGYDTQFRLTSKHHELIALMIKDPRELALPSVGYIELEDAETGESLLVNTRDRSFREAFSQKSIEDKNAVEEFFRSVGVNFISLDAQSDYVDELVRFFKFREKQR